MYRRFGSRVTVVETGDRLIARDDEDISAGVKSNLEAEGVEEIVGSHVKTIQ